MPTLLLLESEQILFRRLSVFVGGCTLSAMERTCAGGDLEPQHVLDALAGLVGRSLVLADISSPPTRYRILDTVRQDAADRLAAAGERTDVYRRHHDWCLSLAEDAAAGLAGPDQQQWLDLVAVDHDNLGAVMERVLAEPDPQSALRMASSLVLYWRIRGPLSEGRRWLEQALAISHESSSDRLVALGRWGSALMAEMLGDFETAATDAERSRSMALLAKDPEVAARALSILGTAAVVQEDAATAVPILEQAADEARENGDVWGLADALARAGHGHIVRGAPLRAIACYDECLQVARAAGHRQNHVIALIGIGRAAMFLGEQARAEELFKEAVTLARLLDGQQEVAEALSSLAELAIQRRALGEARLHLQECMALSPDTLSPALVCTVTGALGRLALEEGDPASANQHFSQSINIAGEGGFGFPLSRALLGRGSALHSLSDPDGARTAFEQALAVARRNGDKHGVATSLSALGTMARRQNDHALAATMHQEALHLQSEFGGTVGIAESLDAFAGLAADHKRFSVAARLWGAAAALRAAGAPYGSAPADPDRKSDITRARRKLGRVKFEADWSCGEQMSLAEAIDYASRGRGARSRPTSGWAGLSPAEARVVDLVVQNLTSGEVGERLFISRRTVDTHLTHIFGKLGIRSRRELARDYNRQSAQGDVRSL